MDVSCHRPFLPGTYLEPVVIPTAQASSFTLQYFPYYVWCSNYYYYYYLGDNIKDHEMDRAHGTSGREEKCVQGFVGIPQHIERLRGNVGLKRRVLLKWILVKYDGMKWSGLIWLRLRTVSGCGEYADEPTHLRRWNKVFRNVGI